MKYISTTGFIIAAVFLGLGLAFGQPTASLADNAALRYWVAFSQLQDSGITQQEAQELNSVLERMGPFDLSKYRDLVQKNTPALETMARGAAMPNCDWGLDYGLGGDVPVDYARKALTLGRLNILYIMQLYHTGDKDGAIHAITAGLRFSRDVANGGSLFATLVAKDLLIIHLITVQDGLRMGQLSASQRLQLQKAVTTLGAGLDWPSAAQRDLEALSTHYVGDVRASAAIGRIASSYAAFLKDQGKLSGAMEAINQAPPELAKLIPDPKRVQEQKQELAEKIQQTRILFQ